MDARIAIVVTELERRFAESWTVSRLARLAGISTSRFAHMFRAELATSPMRYVRSIRLARAAVLLMRTTLPVETIAHAVGYRDRRHFRRDFIRHHGTAPAEWRRLITAAKLA